MSSPIGQEVAFGVYQNSGRFNVKFSSFGDWYYVSSVNITTFWPECYSLTSVLYTLKFALHSQYIYSIEIMIKYTISFTRRQNCSYCLLPSYCALVHLIFDSLKFLLVTDINRLHKIACHTISIKGIQKPSNVLNKYMFKNVITWLKTFQR